MHAVHVGDEAIVRAILESAASADAPLSSPLAKVRFRFVQYDC